MITSILDIVYHSIFASEDLDGTQGYWMYWSRKGPSRVLLIVLCDYSSFFSLKNVPFSP